MKRIRTPRVKAPPPFKPLTPLQNVLSGDEQEAAQVAAEEEATTRREDAYMADPAHHTIAIRTVATNDAIAYFERSGALQQSDLGNYAILAFRQPAPMAVRVELVHRIKALLAYDDATPCMAPWPGHARITWVAFTVGQLRAWLNEKGRTLS